jgi:hypothetical protein
MEVPLQEAFFAFSSNLWIVSRRGLYNSSWRTSTIYFRDIWGVNLFLSLVSKTDLSVWWSSDLVIVLARIDGGAEIHAPEAMTEDPQLCECDIVV